MVQVRACLYFSVIFLCFHVIAGKPIFDLLWCDFLCDDDDDASTSTTGSIEDSYDWIPCDSCPGRRRTTTTTTARTPMLAGMQQQQPFNLMIPPSNGMNVSLSNNNGSWLFNFIPWPAPAATTPGPAGAAPAAGATTAAPAATTAAGAATTAAAAATTAAPAG